MNVLFDSHEEEGDFKTKQERKRKTICASWNTYIYGLQKGFFTKIKRECSIYSAVKFLYSCGTNFTKRIATSASKFLYFESTV
ncbi:hypothetical protein H5410_028130 [Solanum commersonii]|uniref:Uncharacterized protein n=1 Tax=Solanum commersonii TaxID=4109 RepID=A0A9J5Z6L0_SOLCO|nr:hypothetical protein H5410_028130 [Solanum commersonii]